MNNIKIVTAILLVCAPAFANKAAEAYYSGVEQHLRSLPSLEIGYHASGADFPTAGIDGRLAFLRPDGFYHDTPEWTHCELGTEQWRFLKEQQTLMLETAEGRSEWSPESVLLSLNRELVPFDLESGENGDTTLILDAISDQVSGKVLMTFSANKRSPKQIVFENDEGSGAHYEILMWHESVTIDSALFLPPEVPIENRIDFRTQ